MNGVFGELNAGPQLNFVKYLIELGLADLIAAGLDDAQKPLELAARDLAREQRKANIVHKIEHFGRPLERTTPPFGAVGHRLKGKKRINRAHGHGRAGMGHRPFRLALLDLKRL